MNQKVSDAQILGVIAQLARADAPITWRAVRNQLREQFGSAGKTARLVSLCAVANRTREEGVEAARLLEAVRLMQEQRDAALSRALRSEERERAQQDFWASRVYELRQTVATLRGVRSID